MKAFKNLILGLGVLVCASCTHQDEEPSASLNRSPHERVTVTAGPILPSQTTRVTTEREGNVMHFNWEKGDAILLANSSQQIPYLSIADGPNTQFISALSGSESHENYISGEGEVYAYYPYNTGEKIDMVTKTVRINQDEPFLYAIETIQGDTLNLQFHHVFAYLKFNITVNEGKIPRILNLGIEPNYPPLKLFSTKFNFATLQVEYTDYWDELELAPDQFMDSSRLYPILPVKNGEKIGFYYDFDNLTRGGGYESQVAIPEGGLKAGHVYQINLTLTEN